MNRPTPLSHCPHWAHSETSQSAASLAYSALRTSRPSPLASTGGLARSVRSTAPSFLWQFFRAFLLVSTIEYQTAAASARSLVGSVNGRIVPLRTIAPRRFLVRAGNPDKREGSKRERLAALVDTTAPVASGA